MGPMNEAFDPRKSATAFDQAHALRGRSGTERQVVAGWGERAGRVRVVRLRQLEARDLAGALRAIEQWKSEASGAGHEVMRVVVGYEAGLDGFWIAARFASTGSRSMSCTRRALAVERRRRRAKTDRIDLDILLRALLGWLRGEPRHCTMSPIPSEAEEDMREPGRRREALTAARLKVENQMRSLLVRYGGERRIVGRADRDCRLQADDGDIDGLSGSGGKVGASKGPIPTSDNPR